ncbi:MAG: hypothetical protein IH827_06830 [Myxococcales bacterium]|nr:hypothetical protein [Myxococcales bacterium]
MHSDLLIANGMEVSTDLGHILVLGLDRYVPGIRRAEELRNVVEEAGAYMIVAHPFRHFFDPVHFLRQGRQPFSPTPEQAARPSAVHGRVRARRPARRIGSAYRQAASPGMRRAIL